MICLMSRNSWKSLDGRETEQRKKGEEVNEIKANWERKQDKGKSASWCKLINGALQVVKKG